MHVKKSIKKHEVSYFVCDSHTHALRMNLRGFLTEAASIYPKFDAWYYFTFLKDLGRGLDSRRVIFAHDGDQIIGASLLKSDPLEKKFCSFKVADSARNQGIGEELMMRSFAFLRSDDNLITVSDSKMLEFTPLLSKLGFKVIERKAGIYSESQSENYWRTR